MRNDPHEQRLLELIQHGLPLVSRPYAVLGQQSGFSESEVLAKLQQWLIDGVIKRFGVVVRHQRLGYRANAMVVWDIPDERVDATGQLLKTLPFVTLCYRRPRHLPDWPYNLFCMIHGQNRTIAIGQIEQAIEAFNLHAFPRAVLFSTRCFKQRGAIYRQSSLSSDRNQINEPCHLF